MAAVARIARVLAKAVTAGASKVSFTVRRSERPGLDQSSRATTYGAEGERDDTETDE
jgi:hypothetical protein